MKYYIATKLENVKQHNQLRDMLNEQGHKITYDWTLHGPVWMDGEERCKEVAMLEIHGAKQADVVIVLLPGGRGTHIELGAALVFGSTILMYSPFAEDHSLNEQYCAFYSHPGIEKFHTLEDIVKCLRTH